MTTVQASEPATLATPVPSPMRRFAIPVGLLAPAFLWLTAFFLIPLALMAWISISSDGGAGRSFNVLAGSDQYVSVLWTTFRVAAAVTIGALIIGYPVAYLLAISGSITRAIILMAVAIPYWVDATVRSFAWLIVLGDNGLVNKVLIGLGLTSEIHTLLYNMTAVIVAMVQVLLPMTIVTLFGAMLRIDLRLLSAARIHGASEWRAFWTVFFPLSLPGLYGAGLLIFVMALGFYITPAVLGGPRETMIAQTIIIEVRELLDWGVASAAGVLLLTIVTLVITVYNRVFSLSRLWGEDST